MSKNYNEENIKPFTYKQIRDELKSSTDNFKNNSGEFKYSFESEWELAIKILSNKYEFVDYYTDDNKHAPEGLDYFVKFSSTDSLDENFISNELPRSIDNFLQDCAQEFGLFSYSDIDKFSQRFTEDDIKKIKHLKSKINREFNDGADESDPIIQELFKKLESLIKNDSIKESKNELKDRAKKHKRTDKKGAKGWFLNPDAGNVDYNVQFFNHAVNPDSSCFNCSGDNLGEDLGGWDYDTSEAGGGSYPDAPEYEELPEPDEGYATDIYDEFESKINKNFKECDTIESYDFIKEDYYTVKCAIWVSKKFNEIDLANELDKYGVAGSYGVDNVEFVEEEDGYFLYYFDLNTNCDYLDQEDYCDHYDPEDYNPAWDSWKDYREELKEGLTNEFSWVKETIEPIVNIWCEYGSNDRKRPYASRESKANKEKGVFNDSYVTIKDAGLNEFNFEFDFGTASKTLALRDLNSALKEQPYDNGKYLVAYTINDEEDTGSDVVILRFNSEEAVDEAVVMEAQGKKKLKAVAEPLSYTFTYYLNTACRERRPETADDVENDFCNMTLRCTDDFNAMLQAYLIHLDDRSDVTNTEEILRDYELDFKTADDVKKYLDFADISDGSIIICKVEQNNRVVYDNGLDKEYFLSYVEDEIDDELDESLLQDLQRDHERVKREHGEDVYNALNKYCEEGHDLGDVLYSESKWNEFMNWYKSKNESLASGDKFENQADFETFLKSETITLLDDIYYDNTQSLDFGDLKDEVADFEKAGFIHGTEIWLPKGLQLEFTHASNPNGSGYYYFKTLNLDNNFEFAWNSLALEELLPYTNIYSKDFKKKLSNINENIKTSDIDLEENIQINDTLNPKLWDEDKELHDNVRKAIEEIAQAYVELLEENEIKISIKDIILIGSNASYNYTENSDLDLHIIADTTISSCPENLLPKLYDAYKSIFNKKYEIDIKGINVEVYVEADESKANSNGIYSLNDGWIKEPELVNIPEVDTEEELTIWEDKYFNLIEGNPTSADIENFIDELYNLRKTSIAKDGEYAVGNQIFKEFRALGYTDNLKRLKDEIKSKELSI